MSCGENKRKHNCGSRKNQAVCVFYEGYIPEYSDLNDSDCIVLEETTEDLYNIIDDLKEDLNLEDLGNTCIDYDEEDNGNIKVKEALKKHEELICDLQEELDGITNQELDISSWNIDTKCLEDECGTGFNNLKDLIQIIINKLCDCCESNTDE